MNLFGEPLTVNQILVENHYLGPLSRGDAYIDDYGVVVFANPSSRHLPQSRWIELSRWCITSDVKNAGSRQWKAVAAWLRQHRPEVTTVVSYSDPSRGHTGALYRACNWLWAPTWHRLRPSPTGNGSWDGVTAQSVKDRWVFPLQSDLERAEILSVGDASVTRRWPYAEFVEGRGGDYKRWRAETQAV